MNRKAYIVNNIINNMINTLKLNGEIILEGLRIKKELSISDMVRDLGLKRCEARTAIAYMLGKNKIKEKIFGKSKVYRLK